jgi:hypothetical protein
MKMMDVTANSKIQEVNNGQDKVRSAQDQDELKMRLFKSSFNLEASIMLQNVE